MYQPLAKIASLWRSLIGSSPRRIALFVALWLLISISLPTSALTIIGPFRVAFQLFDETLFGDMMEALAATVITAFMLGSTLALGFGATHVVLRTTRRGFCQNSGRQLVLAPPAPFPVPT